MPAVPTVTLPTVAPAASSGLPYQNAAGATPDAFGASIGTAEQGLGRQIEQTGDMLARHANKMQDDLNISRAEDLYLRGDTELSTLTEQFNSLQGANRVNALPKFLEDSAAIREKYKTEAPNSDVSKKFDQLFTRQLGYSIKAAGRESASAMRGYQNEQRTAIKANALDKVAQNAQDDEQFKTSMDMGLEATRASDEHKGSAPEVQASREKAFTTAAWATRLQSMAKNDPLRARDLLEKNKDAIEGGKQLQLQDSINQQIINVQTRVDSDKIIQSGALVPPNLREAVKKFEGYRSDAYWDYKQSSSGYGTKAQPGDENIPADQRKAIHEQRLDNELARAANIVDQFAPGLPSGTRSALISLTFNAGSAWTSQGLGQQVRSGDLEGARQTFLQYNKAGGVTNSALVDRRSSEASWWGGEAVVDRQDQFTGMMDKAKEAAIKVFPDDPANQAKYLDTLQSRLRADHSVMQTAARQIQLDQKNAVQKELLSTGQNVTSYDQLSPQAKQAYDLSPESQKEVFNRQMRQNSSRDVPDTPERQSLFLTIRGEMLNEPEKGMSRNVTELDLTRPQKQTLDKMQQDRKALLAKGSQLNSDMSAVQGLLNDAGIGKSALDTSKNAEWLKFGSVYQSALDNLRDEKKRQPTDAEKQDIAKGLLKEIVTSPGYIWNSKSRTYEAIADKTPIEAPEGDFAAHYATIPRGATYRAPDGSLKVKR